jgi:hypothetical protein
MRLVIHISGGVCTGISTPDDPEEMVIFLDDSDDKEYGGAQTLSDDVSKQRISEEKWAVMMEILELEEKITEAWTRLGREDDSDDIKG